LFFIWYAIQENGEMPSLLIASMSGAILANLALMIVLVMRKQFSFNNIFDNVKSELPHLVKSGGLFFFLQIGVTVLGSVDNLIIVNYLGAATVAMYSVVQKLFQFSSQPSLMVNNGLWPAYANAKKHGDHNFILQTFKRSMIFTLIVSGTLGLMLVFFGRTIISYWTHGDLVVPYTLLGAYFIWSTIDAISNAFGMYLNGLSILKPQVRGLVTLIALGLPLKVYLLSQFGIEYMLIGFSVFFLANHLFWAGYVYRGLIFKKI
jgi:O-antigen/teichoic acid export membrane protein